MLEERTKDFLPTFAVEWSGFIVVHDAGPYIFSTTSDDGSELAVDDTFIVKNGDRFMVTNIDYRGGLRYPRLERDASVPARLDDILTPR